MEAQTLRAVDRQLQRDAGLTAAEYAVLAAVFEAPDRRLRVGDVARALGWEKSRASHRVTAMERGGLLSRRGHSDDGRGGVVEITPEGRRRLLGAVRGHASEVRRSFLDRLSADEQRVLLVVFTRLLEVDGSTGPEEPAG